jgi:hypothetical protein
MKRAPHPLAGRRDSPAAAPVTSMAGVARHCVVAVIECAERVSGGWRTQLVAKAEFCFSFRTKPNCNSLRGPVCRFLISYSVILISISPELLHE